MFLDVVSKKTVFQPIYTYAEVIALIENLR